MAIDLSKMRAKLAASEGKGGGSSKRRVDVGKPRCL